MDTPAIEHEIREALKAVPAYASPRAILVDGFTVREIQVRATRNPFAPSLQEHEALLVLEVPVRYTYSSFETGPADRNTLDELRTSVEACLNERPALRRARIVRFQVEPEEYPAPTDDTPSDASWTVTIRVEIG
jgi:hypothetical protein